jgi:DNA-binding transcriptional MerR regulator
MEEPWTILELAELAAETLAATRPADPAADAGTPSGSARANGRVRDVPNERLVRWYVTVGLVDPPLSRRGRVARYGRRHLLQLVAVKRRQAEGRSLAEIQAELAGATNEALAAVARVPDTRPAPEAPAAAPARFWARQARQPGQPAPAAERLVQLGPAAAEGIGHPGPAATGRSRSPAPADAGPPESPARADAGQQGSPARAAAGGGLADRGAANPPDGLVHGIRLAPGVTLLLQGAGREPGPDDVTGIVNAARSLLAELASRRLRTSGPGQPPDVPGQPPGVGQLTEGAGHDH